MYDQLQVTDSKLPEDQTGTLIAVQKMADEKHFQRYGSGIELEYLPW